MIRVAPLLKVLGCLAGALAVIFSAPGARHGLGLSSSDGELLTALAMMLGFHAPALIAVAIWGAWRGGLILALGLVLFSQAMILRLFFPEMGPGVAIGMVIGGCLMVCGWVWLTVVALLEASDG